VIAAMSRRRGVAMVVMLALTGCPQHTPPEPPRDPPPTVGGGGPGLQTPEPAASGSEGAAEGPGAAPALSAPGGGEDIADILAPRGREREARGGDTGAHHYPAQYLIQELLPHFRLTGWARPPMTGTHPRCTSRARNRNEMSRGP